jgi:DNA-binding NtrC family response regulator
MMTGHGSIDTAVTSMKNGAHDFITKPFDHETLVVRLEKALERSDLVNENDRLIRECRSEDVFENMAGSSVAMQRVYETVRMVAGNDLTVLITGESGTGKDLTARAIHALSPRRKRPFIAVNCPTCRNTSWKASCSDIKRGLYPCHPGQERTFPGSPHRYDISG